MNLSKALKYDQPHSYATLEKYFELSRIDKLGRPLDTDDDDLYQGLAMCTRVVQLADKKKSTAEIFFRKKPYGLGRYYASTHGGYQAMGGKLRRLLMDGNFHDIDIQCCHPVLLAQVCKGWRIPCPKLKEYIRSRDRIFQEITQQLGCSEKAAKNFFTRALFGGSIARWRECWGVPEEKEITSFMLAFHREMVVLIAKVVEKKELEPFVRATKDNKECTKDNPTWTNPASPVALFLQELESKCITSAIDKATKDKFKLVSIIHDGFLIQRSPKFKPAYLQTLAQHVKDTVGFEVVFTEKSTTPTSADHDWLKDLERKASLETPRSYISLKFMFEMEWFKVRHPPMYFRVESGGEISYRKESELFQSYRDRFFQERGGEPDRFIQKWIDDEGKRVFDKFDIRPPPLSVQDGTYNGWQGLAAEKLEDPENPSTYDGFLQEFLDVLLAICGENVQVRSFLMDWIAHMFQRPGELSRVAVCINSAQGTGKGWLVDMIQAVVGSHHCHDTSRGSDIFDKFNASLMNKLFVNIDEMNRSTGRNHHDTIKRLITQPRAVIERKGYDPIKVTNFARFLFTTNNDFTVHIEPGERRFVLIRSSTRFKWNTEVWARLYGALEDPGAVRTLYRFFMERDISAVKSWELHRPQTDIYRDSMRNCVRLEWRFFLDLCCRVVGRSPSADHTTRMYSGANLYEKFQVWATKKKLEPDQSETGFCMFVKDNLFDHGVVKKRTAGFMKYTVFPLKVLERAVALDLIDGEDVPDLGSLQSTVEPVDLSEFDDL